MMKLSKIIKLNEFKLQPIVKLFIAMRKELKSTQIRPKQTIIISFDLC